ncbi:MAG: septum formation protein Maf [Clostridia bacterium]|nr:septum formation protein Maf [Clostridia bacterium]
MRKTEIILASASPRRHEILTLARIPHRVLTAPADEGAIPFPAGDPGDYVIALARLKNDALFAAYGAEIGDTPVLSADTVVWSPAMKKPLGKPEDADDARRMLAMLSGKTHEVWTGVVIRAGGQNCRRESAFAVSTEVRFRTLSEEEIDEYVNSGDPLDKAGAYGYQSGACVFVEEIRGDYYNVVGLPVCRVAEELMRLGI